MFFQVISTPETGMLTKCYVFVLPSIILCVFTFSEANFPTTEL